MLDKTRQEADVNKPACDDTLSRKEFLAKLVQRAALAGSLIAAPKIIDKFLVPPAYAVNSTQHVHDHGPTQHFRDTHAPFRNGGGGGTGSPTSSPNTNTNPRKDNRDWDNGGWG